MMWWKSDVPLSSGLPPWMDQHRVMSVEEIQQRKRDYEAGRWPPKAPQRSLRVAAADKKAGMRLAELRGFVDEAAALELGEDAKVSVEMGLRGQIQVIQIVAKDAK